jgi:hypothetical protein
VAQLVEALRYKSKVTGLIPDGVIGIFHWYNPSGRTVGPGVDSASNRKAAGAYSWQPYLLHVPIVLKSGSLNFLEPLGPVQGCNGIALPFIISQKRFSLNNFLSAKEHLLKWLATQIPEY